jgi:hypothetical protein
VLKANRPYSLSLDLIYWNPLEFAQRRTYRSLKRAWIGFKQEGNHNKMKYYADILKEETEQPDDTKLNEGDGTAVNEL